MSFLRDRPNGIGKVFAVFLLYLSLSFDYNGQVFLFCAPSTMIRLTVASLLGVCVWLCQAAISAQDAPAVPPTAPPPAPPGKTETIIRRTPLDAVVQFTDEGRQIVSLPLPGDWPLTVFDGFLGYILQKDQQNLVPPFALGNVSATGTIAGHYVETEVRFEFSTSGSQPVRIPLGFKEGILPSTEKTDQLPFRYTGNGSAYLTVDPNEEQIVAVIFPQAEQNTGTEDSDKSEKPGIVQQHTLTFSLLLPLSQNSSGECRLQLSFPRSLTSQFQLVVPMNNIAASVTQGSLLTLQENAEKQSTTLSVQGLRADTEITWNRKKIEIVDDRPVLLVDRASIDVRLNAQSAVYDATLPVSSTTGSFEQLQIRLPRGAMLDRESVDRHAVAGDYSVGEVNDESVVTVQFSQKTSGPVSLRLRAIQQFEGEGEGEGEGDKTELDFQRDLSGFEVLGADRQAGVLSVSVFPSGMKPRWRPIRGIRRETGGTSTTLSTAGDTRFEFTSQPFSLNVQVVSPQTRINVKPVYQFQFSRGQIEMDARLSYTVSGSKTDVLYLRLPDAQWDRINFASSSIVDTTDVRKDASGELIIPLRNPREGTIDIELSARRSIPTEEEQVHRIVLPMPKPLVDWSEPADVTIELANYIEMQPIGVPTPAFPTQHLSGMIRQPRRTPRSAPDLQQEPLLYRTESEEGVFVADLIYRQQKINTTMETEVRLLEGYNQVTQTISYNASYVAIDRLYLLVPDTLDSISDIQIRLDNRPLERWDTIAAPTENVPRGWKRKMVRLPESRFRFPLKIEYSLPSSFSISEDVTTFRSLSFLYPEEVPVLEHRVHFFAPTEYKLELQDESKAFWEPFRDPRRPSLGTAGTFRSVPSQTAQPPNRIALSISVSEKNDSGTTIIERAWVQTWLSGEMRHDRATYFVKTAKDSIAIQLPLEATRDYQVVVRVDHQPVTPNTSPMGILTLPIAPEQQNRSLEIFIEYRYTFKLSGWEVPIVLPTFPNDPLIQYAFWQVFPPKNMHIVACTGGWTLEYDWTWNGLFFGRTPSIRKSDIGFEADSDDIISGVNQYLFSHLHSSGFVTLYLVSRPLIIFGSSGIALLVGLVLIYVRQSRYIGSLFGLGVGLMAVLLYQPSLVLLMLQAAVFGVFLALGAGYVYRIFHRQRQWIPSTFPTLEELSQPYITPVPSQTVHEVIIDDSSNRDAIPAITNNNHHDSPPNDQL